MNARPEVSVIIPVYNAEPYLRQCLDSLLAQTMTELEILCVDDGSTDGSPDILREYENRDPRVRVLRQERQNAGAARNNGLAEAGGEYLVFLDADDFFEPELLEKQVKLCETFRADIGLCGADQFDVRTGLFSELVDFLKLDGLGEVPGAMSPAAENIYQITTPSVWNKIFRADFIREHGLSFQSIPRANDLYFTMAALAEANTVAFREDVLVHYRVGVETSLQTTCEEHPDGFLRALLAVRERLTETGRYERLERSFIQSLIENSRYNLARLTDHPEAFQRVGRELTGLLPEIGFRRSLLLREWPWNDLRRLLRGERPTISIVVPVYNAERFLRPCLDSLVSQTMEKIEIVCVDDASTDGSLGILEEYEQEDLRLTLIRHEKNQRENAARKHGAEIASGEYILFVDSDDTLEPRACEILSREMAERRVDILQFNTNIICDEEQDPQRVKNLEAFLRPYDGTLKGRDVFRGCFDEIKYRHTVWNKCYSAELCKKAFAETKTIPMPMAGDEYSFLILAWYADSYAGLPNEYLYNYNFGVGVTGKNVLTETDFQKYCTTALVADEIRDFLLSRECTEENVRIAEKIRAQLRSFCAGEWDLYCREEDKAREYDEMLRHWPAADVAAEMARIFWNDKGRAVRTLETAHSLRAAPRKVRRLGVYYHRMTIGGAENVAAQLLELWTSMGYECVLITDLPPSENDYPLPEGVDRVVIPSYFTLTPTNYLERGRALEAIVDKYALDAVVYHAWVATCLLWDLLVFKAKGVAVIAHCHSAASFLLRLGSPQWADLPQTYRLLDGVVTLSETERYFWRQFNSRVFTVVNPVSPALRSAAPSTLEDPAVIWVGRLSDEKRPSDAIRILQRVRRRVPEARLVMVGDNDQDPGHLGRLETLARELGVSEAVTFPGYQKDVMPWYRMSSVYLMTSDFEGFPMSLLEAGAAGLPCVMYRLDYLTMVRDNPGIFSVENGDLDAAARRIAELLLDADKRREAGAAARARMEAVTGFDLAGAWRGIFASLETEPSGPPISPDGQILWTTLLEHYRIGVDRHNADKDWLRKKYESEAGYYKNELDLVKRSFSFRLGQLLTWPARKARTFVRCWRENGFRYTVRVYFLDRKKA